MCVWRRPHNVDLNRTEPSVANSDSSLGGVGCNGANLLDLRQKPGSTSVASHVYSKENIPWIESHSELPLAEIEGRDLFFRPFECAGGERDRDAPGDSYLSSASGAGGTLTASTHARVHNKDTRSDGRGPGEPPAQRNPQRRVGSNAQHAAVGFQLLFTLTCFQRAPAFLMFLNRVLSECSQTA